MIRNVAARRPFRPRLRSIETVVVNDRRFGRALMLRDNEGITENVAVIPAFLVPIVACFDGRRTVDEIAEDFASDVGRRQALAEPDQAISVELIEHLAIELEQAMFLDGARYRAERRRIEQEFARAEVRLPAHAGGAYHDDPNKLRRFLNVDCLAAADGMAGKGTANGGRLVGLIAPHIDPWRGKIGYGHAYRMLRDWSSPTVDTFVLLGTSHAPMREPFSLCRKAFETPFGRLPADTAAIDAIADEAPFDAYADLFNHKREHSLEFQAIFVKHLVGERPVRIIPVLCGLSGDTDPNEDPTKHDGLERFVQALRTVCHPERTVVIAGADLAHVGPRFGDRQPYSTAQRQALEQADRASLDLATRVSHRGFFAHVAADLETRRVCGLAPIYTLLRLLPADAKGTVVHYEQTVDPEEGSLVSHAAVGFFSGR